MFEILLLIGLFSAGISQLLPGDPLPSAPKQQNKARARGRRSITNYVGVNQHTSKNTPSAHSKLQPRPHFTNGKEINVSTHRETG